MDPESKVSKFDQMVRPVVTLGMLVIFGWLSVTDKISSDAALGLIGMVFGFWFQSRSPGTGAATTRTTETDPSGAKRETTTSAPAGVVLSPPSPPKGITP